MVNATRPPSILRSLMKPRLTMSRFGSGSRTTFNASRTPAGSTCIHQRISYTRPPMPDGSPNRGVMIVLAYLWLLALVPLVVEKNDPEIRWHAGNGIVLMVAEIVALGAYVALTTVVSLAMLGLGFVLGILLVFAWIAVLGLHVVAILKGIGG